MKHWLIIHQKYILKKKKKKRKQTGYYLEPLTTETLKISIGNN